MNAPIKRKRSTWIDVLLPVAIISFIGVGLFIVLFSNKNEAAPLPKSNINPSETIDLVDSKYPGIKIITETSNDSFAPYAIQYPQSIHNQFNEDVSKYINKIKSEYISNMNEYRSNGGKLSGELNISFITQFHDSGNYSFILMKYNYKGNANGKKEIGSFHLNPETGVSHTILDILDHDTGNLEKLSELVHQKIVNDATSKEYLFPALVDIYTKPLWINYKNFALTNKEIIFYFDEYQFTAGAVGSPIVAISLADINDLLADEYQYKKDEVKQAPQENKNDSEVEDVNKTTPSDDDSEVSAQNETLKVALTFDDGPHPQVTRQILAILKKYDAKATFFMLGSRVEYYPDIANEVHEAGHEIGNHSWNHPDLTKSAVEKVRNEINRTSEAIEDATGQKAATFRPPYGAFNDLVKGQTDLPFILWDVDTLDWKYKDPHKLLQMIKSSVRNESIVLMHDIHQSTADGLDAILAYLKNEGYSFVTVSELNK